MRKKKDKGMQINYLDLIPEKNQSLKWHTDLKDRVILEVEKHRDHEQDRADSV